MTTNQALGLLVGITVVVALLADLLFLPPLLMALDGTRETTAEIRARLPALGRVGARGSLAWGTADGMGRGGPGGSSSTGLGSC